MIVILKQPNFALLSKGFITSKYGNILIRCVQSPISPCITLSAKRKWNARKKYSTREEDSSCTFKK